jgi:cytochrome oxidase assembly protein ShyY1
VVRLFSSTLQKWSTPLLCLFLFLLAASIGFAVWQVRRHRKSEAAEDRATAAAGGD